MTIWGWTGFSVIVYLAALQGVPAELHEAAAIDGASAFTRFRTITVPLLGPANLFLVVWLTINALQLFDEVYATTRGGPLRATTVIVYYLWDRAFVQFDAGYAAAMAYALFVVILVITAVQFRLARRHVHTHDRHFSCQTAPQTVPAIAHSGCAARSRLHGVGATAVQPMASGPHPADLPADRPAAVDAHHLAGDRGRGQPLSAGAPA